MKISIYNSHKLRALSFLGVMMVLYIHSVYKEAVDYPIAQYVQELCAFNGLAIIANPLYFCFSGFLFFCGVTEISNCYPKIRKRLRTLLIPYLIWNIVFVLWYVILAIIPGISKYVNGDILGNLMGGGIAHAIKSLFIDPAGFHLWFIRDLMIYIFLSPLFYVCLKRFKSVLLIILFVAGTYGIIYFPSEIKVWGCFYFVLGAYIAIYSSLDKIENSITLPLAYICGLIYLSNAIVRPMGIVSMTGTDMVIELSGLIAIWKLYDEIVNKAYFKSCIRKLEMLGGYSFFIYLFHEPTFNIIKKIGLKVTGIYDWSLILLYLVNPLIMAVIAICVAIIVQRTFPRIYSILVGGR